MCATNRARPLPKWHNRMDIKRLLNCCLRMVQSFFGEQLVNCRMKLLGMDSDWLLARVRMVNHAIMTQTR